MRTFSRYIIMMTSGVVSSKNATFLLILVFFGSVWAENIVNSCLTSLGIEPMKKFGCTFENQNYFVPTDSIYDSVYGDSVEPMEFNDVSEFNDVLHVINEEYSKILGEFVCTDIPEFIDFYDQYKASSGSVWKLWRFNFTNFYRGYVPKFFPCSSVSSLSIELLDRLASRDPRLGQSAHLISCHAGVYKELLRQVDQELVGWTASGAMPEPPKYWFDNHHVAACLRISIAGRRGFVLMDIGQGLESPVVIMADKKDPHTSGSLDHQHNESSVEFSLYKEHYILSRYPDNKRDFHEMNLYFIGKPYCSFEMTTIKTYITDMYRVMARRDSTGLVIASLNFNLAKRSSFFMSIRDSKNVLGEGERIRFGTRQSLREVAIKQHYDQVIKKMNYPGLEEMLTKVEDIFKDNLFKEYVWNIDYEVNRVFRGNIMKIKL